MIAADSVEWTIVAGPDFSADIAALDRALSSIEAVLDPEKLRQEIAELQDAVSAPDLWDDVESAQRVTSRLSAVQADVDRVESLRTRAAGLRQEMVDARVRARTYTREQGTDSPEVAGWTWPG